MLLKQKSALNRMSNLVCLSDMYLLLACLHYLSSVEVFTILIPLSEFYFLADKTWK